MSSVSLEGSSEVMALCKFLNPNSEGVPAPHLSEGGGWFHQCLECDILSPWRQTSWCCSWCWGGRWRCQCHRGRPGSDHQPCRGHQWALTLCTAYWYKCSVTFFTHAPGRSGLRSKHGDMVEPWGMIFIRSTREVRPTVVLTATLE